MSKIICEICDTAYPDTEMECPVCGFPKPEVAEVAPEAAIEVESAPAKPGRFAKGTVSKKAAVATEAAAKGNKKRNNSDAGLIIAIIVLLIAIVVTSAHIYFNYFAPSNKPVEDNIPAQTTTEPSKETLPPQTEGTTETEDLSCTALTLYEQSVMLNKAGDQWILNVVPTPANTTDTITYTSANQDVATVDADGCVTAVADGETTITITCGEISVECKVTCEFPPEETEPEETEPEETENMDSFKFKKTDITFYREGETYKLYDGDIDPAKIVWSVGKSSVATITNGVVKAVGKGMTNVYAEYNGVKISCIVRCDF